MSNELEKGLEGVLVAESELSYIDGDEGTLIYRGYSIEDLAREASYEEVLYLLWHGHLPTESERSAFAAAMREERELDPAVVGLVEDLVAADEEPMGALRTAVSMLSAFDPEPDADPGDTEAALAKGRRIAAKIPTVLAAFERVRQGQDPVDPHPELSYAGNFLYMLTGTEPDDVSEETMDMALTLHADHGLNASTFTAMVVGSTMADIYNCVTGGIGALSGPLHGGANVDVMEALHEIDASGKGPVEWARAVREGGERIPGFGHRVYSVKDPRANILEERLRELSAAAGDTKWLDYTTAIEQFLREEGVVEKGIAPNVDFYSGSVYDQLGIPTDMYTAIFAMSRAGGWIAHTIEYQAENRLIRPRGRYIGPDDRDVPPIGDR